MTPDPYTQLAHHLHALGMGYPLKDELLEILQANFSLAEVEVALALPNTRIPLELVTADEVSLPSPLLGLFFSGFGSGPRDISSGDP